MENNQKLYTGILIGLVIALVIAAVVYLIGHHNNQVDTYNTNTPTQSTLPTNTTNANSNLNTQSNIPANTNSNTNTNSTTSTSQQKVSGTFRIDSQGLLGDLLCFTTSNATATIPAKTFFCFDNQSLAMNSLKVNDAGKLGQPACDYISGKADINISEFTKPSIGGDAPNSAKFISVNKITQPAQCGRG